MNEEELLSTPVRELSREQRKKGVKIVMKNVNGAEA